LVFIQVFLVLLISFTTITTIKQFEDKFNLLKFKQRFLTLKKHKRMLSNKTGGNLLLFFMLKALRFEPK